MFNYYRDPDRFRFLELMYCINKNLELKCIDEFIVFIENTEHQHDLPNDDRITFVLQDRRMEFNDCLQYAEKNLPDTIIFIINLDIFLDNTIDWNELDTYFNGNRTMVLSRYNLKSDFSIYTEEPDFNNGNFCDAWIFKTPLKPEFLQEDTKFCVGNAPQCDNLMMYLMAKHYTTYNYAKKYKVYHYDVCRKQNGPTLIMTDKTDYRASVRKQEHLNIPTNQDYDTMLVLDRKPVMSGSWLEHPLKPF